MRNMKRINKLCKELKGVEDRRGSKARALRKQIRELVPEGYEFCPKCAEVKPLSDFTPRGLTKLRCAACQRQEVTDYTARKGEVAKEWARRAAQRQRDNLTPAERKALEGAVNARNRGAEIPDGEAWTSTWKATVPVYEKAIALRKLFPNVSWSVDHILPIAKGGRHEVSNLQVIPRGVNQVKRDHLVSELDTLLSERGLTMDDVYQRAGVDSELVKLFNESVTAYRLNTMVEEVDHWLSIPPLWDGVQDKEWVEAIAARIE